MTGSREEIRANLRLLHPWQQHARLSALVLPPSTWGKMWSMASDCGQKLSGTRQYSQHSAARALTNRRNLAGMYLSVMVGDPNAELFHHGGQRDATHLRQSGESSDAVGVQFFEPVCQFDQFRLFGGSQGFGFASDDQLM